MASITVLGANGRTGRLIVTQSLTAGHTVTAIVRDPTTFALDNSGLLTLAGFDELPGVLAGHDVVVSALGSRGRAPTTIYSGTAATLVGALPARARVMVISSAGLDVPMGAGPVTRLGARVLHRVMRHVYDDMERMERILAESDLDWTAMRPTGLNDAPASGNPRVSVGATGRVGSRTSRADLAAYILAHLTDPATFRQPVAISS